jgi:quercetin dioxygenase-like cupin family protein
MKIFRGKTVPWQSGDARTFAGIAQTKRLASDDTGVAVGVYRVEFDPGARTYWHVHSGPQWLLIVEGQVRVQKWGEPVQEVDPGDAIVIQPGEKHWHGAATGARGAHIAVNVSATTEWLEQVEDEHS